MAEHRGPTAPAAGGAHRERGRSRARVTRVRALVVAALAVVVAGCAVGPSYRPPQVDVPADTRGQDTPLAPESLADLPWWEVFGDPVLQELISTALANNYDLSTAIARVEQARNEVTVVRADLFPQLGYRGEARRQRTFVPLGGGNTTFNIFLGAFDVAWEIDVWGRIRRATEAARAEFAASEAFRRGVMLTLVSDVARGYFDLLDLDRQREIALRALEVFGDTLSLFERRYQGGIGTMLEVSRAQATVTGARADLHAIEQARAIRENQLSVLLGRPPADIPRGTPLVETHPLPEVPLGLPSDLLRRRPDVLEAEQGMIAANADVGVAVASFFPRIGLSSLYGGQSTELESIVKSGGNIWAIAGSLAGPLFQGGRLLGNYRASGAAFEASVALYQQTVVAAFAEVASALVSHQKLKGIRIEREETVEALRTSVELSLQRYEDGIASYFEVLEAQQLLFPEALRLARVQRDQLVAIVDLYRALGGGWDLAVAEWQTPLASAGAPGMGATP